MEDDIFANTTSASTRHIAIFSRVAFQVLKLVFARRLLRRSKRLAWRLHASYLLLSHISFNRLFSSGPSHLRSAAGIKLALFLGEASCETRPKIRRERQKFDIGSYGDVWVAMMVKNRTPCFTNRNGIDDISTAWHVLPFFDLFGTPRLGRSRFLFDRPPLSWMAGLLLCLHGEALRSGGEESEVEDVIVMWRTGAPWMCGS
ncbi:hypothetical protein VTG60DRAFT_1876 [Thermothelomyces hinnuleus]